MLAAVWRFLTWQRLAADRLRIQRPRREAALCLAYALAYVGLSWLTGLAIRHHPRPILGASYFTYDVVYVFLFKILGLLVVPLVVVAALDYALRDVFAGDRFDRRTVVGMVIGFAIGALLNARHFGPIASASAHFPAPALVGRVTLGLLVPLVFAALPEEIFYRGLLQPRLERVAGRMTGVLVTAVLFAAWHIPSRYVLASGVEGTAGDLTSVLVGTGAPAFVIGLVFGLIYDRYRRLLPLIAAHWGIDAVIGVGSLLGLPI